jgi:ParB-like nuclease family protein
MKDSAVSELTVTYQLISALKPFLNNARRHSKRQIRKIAESINAFGFTNPVLIDHANTIVAGHGRVAAAKLLGMDRVPTVRLEGLSPDQIRAFALADNRLAEKAGWDKEVLAIELQHLITIDNDFDVTVTGFQIREINLIVREPTGKRDQDDIVGAPEARRAVSKSGDIWLLGPHRIVCGDSLDAGPYAAIDVAIRRWQKCTGDRAIHAVTGKYFDEVVDSSEVSRD